MSRRIAVEQRRHIAEHEQINHSGVKAIYEKLMILHGSKREVHLLCSPQWLM